MPQAHLQPVSEFSQQHASSGAVVEFDLEASAENQKKYNTKHSRIVWKGSVIASTPGGSQQCWRQGHHFFFHSSPSSSSSLP
jgi:endonuclease I